jgi:hypothetical protein
VSTITANKERSPQGLPVLLPFLVDALVLVTLVTEGLVGVDDAVVDAVVGTKLVV